MERTGWRTRTTPSRGFKLKRKLVKLSQWIPRPGKHHPDRFQRYQRLAPPSRSRNPICRILDSVKHLQLEARKLCHIKSGQRGYVRIGRGSQERKKGAAEAPVPRGHLAVCVGQSEDDFCRVLVPVIYFNHPLFGELLREAEKVYGYDYPGVIKLPCGMSEFERVQTRIATGDGGCGRRTPWVRH